MAHATLNLADTVCVAKEFGFSSPLAAMPAAAEGLLGLQLASTERSEPLPRAKDGATVEVGAIRLLRAPGTHDAELWVPADGRLLGREEFGELYGAIGSDYGCGDEGCREFRLPDLRRDGARPYVIRARKCRRGDVLCEYA